MSDVHNEFDVVLFLLLFAWFYFMDSVLWIIIFYCVASVIKKENTKIYYLVVVIMIEKSFFYVKNSYKSFVISLTKCKTSWKQCFKQWSWICWAGGGSVCSFSFGLCLLSFWRTLRVDLSIWFDATLSLIICYFCFDYVVTYCSHSKDVLCISICCSMYIDIFKRFMFIGKNS